MAVGKFDIIEQYFDNDGNPLAGGKIYTYQGGNLTPRAAYTDATGGTAHANPIILDSAGRPPADGIWFTQDVAYKVVVTDANDVEVESIDNFVLGEGGSAALPRCLTYIIDGAGSELSTGVAGVLHVPFAVTLDSCTLLADQTGSVELDILTGTYSAYDTGSSIVAAAPPTISSAIKAQDNTLSGWTTEIPGGNFLQFSVASVTDITKLTIALGTA